MTKPKNPQTWYMPTIFEDPPPKAHNPGYSDKPKAGRNNRRLEDWFNLVRWADGEWLRYPTGWDNIKTAQSLIARVKRFGMCGVTPGEFETACRKKDDGQTYVYARLIKESDA